jgi:hypothetical protein
MKIINFASIFIICIVFFKEIEKNNSIFLHTEDFIILSSVLLSFCAIVIVLKRRQVII